MLDWQLLGIFLLAPLPLVWRLLVPAAKSPDVEGIAIPFATHIQESTLCSSSASDAKSLSKLILAWALWLALLTAAAGPIWVGEPIPLPQAGRDMLLAIDTSGSMREADMVIGGQAVNRLDAVKVVASEFVDQRKGDRIGLILFGDQAYLQAPLTFDVTSIKKMLLDTFVEMAGKKTAIGDAIGLAIKRLQEEENTNKVLILLTDGRNTAGQVEPLDAARLAKEQGLKIYTIGVGADSRVQSGFFGNILSMGGSDLDEDVLTEIATLTGGKYYRARNPQELINIYAELNELESIEKDEQIFRPTKPLFYWPLAAAILLSLLLFIQQVGWITLLMDKAASLFSRGQHAK